jgi:DNA-binding NtrC family response regulator
MSKGKVLVIDDDPSMLDLTSYHLQSRGYEASTAETGETGLRIITEQNIEVALTDLQLPDIDGIELVKKLKEASPAVEVIMVTGFGSLKGAIDAIKAGAFHYVEKPVEYEELFIVLENALEHRRQAEEIRQLRDHLSTRTSYYNIIGSSKGMQDIYEIVDSVAESDANIMIIGESGTGKELIANAIHFKSLRSKKPFVKINCSALPKELIESELFGHTKGAFTGASTEKMGLIGQAAGGSLLLDEIGDMPLELQPKLLRVLQERVYYRLGSEKALEADFRLISSTNCDSMDALREGRLREDLYYRINTVEIHLPPLRERAEDIQHLAEHFLRLFAEKYHRPVRAISHTVYERMFAYPWPGNVRELQNVIERAVLLSKSEVIEENILPSWQPSAATGSTGSWMTGSALAGTAADTASIPHHAHTESKTPQVNYQEMSLEQLAGYIVSKIPDSRGDRQPVDIITQFEGALVSAALDRTRGNKQAAANLLGLYRPRLYTMLRKHNLHNTIRKIEHNVPETGAETINPDEAEAAINNQMENSSFEDKSISHSPTSFS